MLKIIIRFFLVCLFCMVILVLYQNSNSTLNEKFAYYYSLQDRILKLTNVNRSETDLVDVSKKRVEFTVVSGNLLDQVKTCFGSMTNGVIQKEFFSNFTLFPLDTNFAQCMLSKRTLSEENSNRIFGLMKEDWFLFTTNVRNTYSIESSECSLSVISPKFMVFDCHLIKIHFVLVTDKRDYWTFRDLPERENKSEEEFALPKLNYQKVLLNETKIISPYDLDLFYRFLNYAKLVQCDLKTAVDFKKKYANYYKNGTKLTMVNFGYFVKYRNLLHSLRMTPLLCSGTLLGWYRECGIIPYTHDFDFCVPISSYNEHLETSLLNHKEFQLVYRYGRLEDSLEYTILDPKRSKIDLFFLYQESNYTWMGGVGKNRQKLKSTYPLLKDICSTDLMGSLFHVPCNYLNFIKADYGEKWMVPIHQNNFYWYKSALSTKIVGTYTKEEWPDVAKCYLKGWCQ